jgi:hypothetical protein
VSEATPRVYRLATDVAPAAALSALARAVADWDGEWSGEAGGGALRLPVHAGLRHGLVRGRATAVQRGGGSELVVEIVAEEWALHRVAVALLVTSGVAALAVVLWPFFPALGSLVPLGLVLAVTAWLVILSRLRNQGPEELLAQVRAALATAEGGGNRS